jgi:hypothetical protein
MRAFFDRFAPDSETPAPAAGAPPPATNAVPATDTAPAMPPSVVCDEDAVAAALAGQIAPQGGPR